jgi:hypothetical protein
MVAVCIWEAVYIWWLFVYGRLFILSRRVLWVVQMAQVKVFPGFIGLCVGRCPASALLDDDVITGILMFGWVGMWYVSGSCQGYPKVSAETRNVCGPSCNVLCLLTDFNQNLSVTTNCSEVPQYQIP